MMLSRGTWDFPLYCTGEGIVVLSSSWSISEDGVPEACRSWVRLSHFFPGFHGYLRQGTATTFASNIHPGSSEARIMWERCVGYIGVLEGKLVVWF